MTYSKYILDLVDKNECIDIELDKNIYSKSTILKCCYKFTDKCYIYLKVSNNFYHVYMQYKDKTNPSTIKDEFLNEMLDQELREIVLLETKKVRDTIVTRALLSGQ